MYPGIEYIVIDFIEDKIYTADHSGNIFNERMAKQFADINNTAFYQGSQRLVVFRRVSND